jgi:phosphatidylserine decarboxylase
VKLARGAGRWIGVASVVPLVVGLYSASVGFTVPSAGGFVVSLTVPVFVTAFFRDPDRQPDGEGVLSPADGKVTVLREEDGHVRLGVFMGLHNVHVNRAPVGGEVDESTHHEGGHRPAFTKESERNERLKTRLDDFVVVQIAGAFARRITTYINEGSTVGRGERIGVIAFGSRVDVVFPSSYTPEDLAVEKGDRVRAGESVLAPSKDEQ